MNEWIELTDVETPKKRNAKVLVRASSIASMQQRKSYTTLRLNGHYLHVSETIEAVQGLLQRPSVAEYRRTGRGTPSDPYVISEVDGDA